MRVQCGYNNWHNEFSKLLGTCFAWRKKKANKSAPRKNFKCARDVIARISKKGRIQRKVAKQYQERLVISESKLHEKIRTEKLKSTMSQLTSKEKFSPVGYWKMKQSVRKSERKTEVMSSVLKANGVEVDGPDAVKDAYKEEFEKRLANRTPVVGWEDFVTETNNAIRTWLKGSSRSSPPFTLKELKQVVSSLKNNKSPGVDGLPAELFKYAGDGVLK